MVTKADIESFLLKSEVDFVEDKFGTWVVRNMEGHGLSLVVRIEEPIVVFHADVMDVPKQNVEAFLRKVLELNASEMLFASFGLEGDRVVAGGALALETLDYGEFQSMLDDVALAASNHKATLAEVAGVSTDGE
jgi:hypothetical protein